MSELWQSPAIGEESSDPWLAAAFDRHRLSSFHERAGNLFGQHHRAERRAGRNYQIHRRAAGRGVDRGRFRFGNFFWACEHGRWFMANHLWETEPVGDGGNVPGGGNTCSNWLGD